MILAFHQTPTLTKERYEEVVRGLTGGKARIESQGLPFEGLLFHASGAPGGFLVFDVFSSQESVDAFRAALGSTPQDVGIAEPPQFFEALTVYAA